MVVKHSDEVESKIVDHAVSTRIQWLLDRHDGVPNFELRKFRIAPGGRILKHLHPDVEHEQYVLKGSYVVGIGDTVHSVKPGDVLYIPAGTPHWYENNGEEDVEFLCIIPRRDKYDSKYL